MMTSKREKFTIGVSGRERTATSPQPGAGHGQVVEVTGAGPERLPCLVSCYSWVDCVQGLVVVVEVVVMGVGVGSELAAGPTIKMREGAARLLI